MLLFIRHYVGPLRELVLPMFLIIDLYYRIEWFELHTTWGKALLAPFFGGE